MKIKQEDNEKWVVVQGRSKLFEGGMAKALGGGKHVHRSGGMHLQDNLDTRKSLLRQFYKNTCNSVMANMISLVVTHPRCEV